ncbi:DNA polymerase III subunit gamma/tau [Desulfovibrio ferrophilus]|uniref:DNA polymerase III subunit gamma/tau n=1 Tax=Desulfovibrio ferrophilus TaxID=241368 RepID=A0A2Z6AXB5_9BACT|nr:DNA polymerase III subunit gamma/tau [Desulfovibrio ferrophilus]BBD07894.1 DNA polymerase III subunits gamma and tau [Desulfovibrio ferrophilus]
MSQSHLTHKYRPQLFSEVAGQEMIKAILSRAAQTDTVAPAYLFSGTRGVGKTTIARIFAKAINCENGPTAEPCNQCSHCRQIQAGAAVDVAEIDGASHTGVDNVRSLKEDVGFAPIDCRYKVFIIDEAHMLSKGAFNALLKTLEEPPPHATFIMATTEPHKFPATIISRCQHYTYQRLTQKELEEHLTSILEKESLPFDEDAVLLLARRGAGSVRDSMSLMGQVLALGSERLTASDVRQVLGLAGRDIMFRLLEAVQGQDCVGVSRILREVLDQGLDLGFFLRELTECWRNMFLLAQAGDKAMDVLDVPGEEADQWREWSGRFSLAHIHACWQLTLEGQQRVKSSVEPALALELLLLNLAYLPRLMPLESIASTGQAPAAPGPPAASTPVRQSTPVPLHDSAHPAYESMEQAPPRRSAPAAPAPASAPDSAATSGNQDSDPAPAEEDSGAGHGVPVVDGPKTWKGFLGYAAEVQDKTGQGINGLQQAHAVIEDGRVILECVSRLHMEQIKRGEAFHTLTRLAHEYFGPGVEVQCTAPEKKQVNHKELRKDATKHPLVEAVMEGFDARIVDVRPAKED